MIFPHKFDLVDACQVKNSLGGKRLLHSKLQGMSLAVIELAKGGFREPHWHPNASEITYCMEGKALVTIFAPNNAKHTFTLEKGEVVFFPQGYIHHLENIYEGPTKLLLGFNHEAPEDLNLSSSVQAMQPHVVAGTFGVNLEKIKPLFAHKKEAFIALKKNHQTNALSGIPNPFKLNLERINPQLVGSGGYAKAANAHSFKTASGLALYSLVIEQKGIREPHWHPNATEMNYVLEGKARITIVSPSGQKDEFEVEKNQGSFIPKGYFHSIENLGKDNLHMAVFFNTENPEDIGLSGALSAYSDDVLAAVFGVEQDIAANIPKILEDRLIVK